MKLISIILNWSFKLFMSWIAYYILAYFSAPEWAMIAVVAIVATDSTFTIESA